MTCIYTTYTCIYTIHNFNNNINNNNNNNNTKNNTCSILRILFSLISVSCSSVTNDIFRLCFGLRYSNGSLNYLPITKPTHSVVDASKF